MATGFALRGSALASLLAVAALAACAAPSPDPAPADVPAAPAAGDIPALAVATSPCGRHVLRIEHAQWSEESGRRPRLSLPCTLRSTEPDTFPTRGSRVTDLVMAGGAHFREGDLGAHPADGALDGRVYFHGLQVYERDDALRALRVECRVLRVLSWREYPIACDGAGDERVARCPPLRLQVSGTPTQCIVSCSVDWSDPDAESPGVPRVGDMDLFSHDHVLHHLALRDAGGRTLDLVAAAGSGGGTTAYFGDLRPGGSAGAIAYPVRGVLRVPDRYVVELVEFRFADVPLVREPPAAAAVR